MMKEEFIEVLDENGNGTNRILPISEIKKKGYYHRVISVMIINSNKQILLCRRDSKMHIFPNLWAGFINGHIKAYENSVDASIREIEEEIGLKVSKKELNYLYTKKDNNSTGTTEYINNVFYDHYLIVKEIQIDKLKLQPNEVSEVKLIDFDEFKLLVKNKDTNLVPNYDDFEKMIKIIKKLL